MMIDTPMRRGDLIDNVRGVLLAAYLPTEIMMKILNCSEAEAKQFQERAQGHVDFLNAEISRARH